MIAKYVYSRVEDYQQERQQYVFTSDPSPIVKKRQEVNEHLESFIAAREMENRPSTSVRHR